MIQPVRITAIRQETPSIKGFELDPGEQELTFLPGQWIDCYAETNGLLEVAGYSITSSPLTGGTIEIAVKLEGENPVTHLLHEQAEVGDVLQVDGGQGEFYYRRENGDSIVLIGGGIGLTPLMSIIAFVAGAHPEVRATLVYSARTPDELLFRARLEDIANSSKTIRCLLTVTGPTGDTWGGHVGRIGADLLTEAGIDLDARFYVCGPPAMIQDMVSMLDGLGVPPERIEFEGWLGGV